jgi:hypothetical protein
MAEPLRKDEELTTADLVGRSEKPKLVRSGRLDDTQDLGEAPDRVRTESNFNESASAVEVTERQDELTDKQNVARQQTATTAVQPSPLFSESDVTDSRSRWSDIQAAFVDEPRRAVENADSLVASLMKKLAEGFANERERLEKQWDRGEDVSTEDLRIALQRYRSFFDRLLKA